MKFSTMILATASYVAFLGSSVASAEGNCGDESFWHNCWCAENGQKYLAEQTCLGVLDDGYNSELAKAVASCNGKVSNPDKGSCELENTGKAKRRRR